MYKIVVADDDRFSLHLIKDFLSKTYEVVTFNRGTALLEYMQEDWADLILLDYRMPEKDGMEVLQELKKNPHTVTIPVVVLTGEQDVAIEIACLQKGAEDFITKPYSPEVVTSRISRILELNKLQNDLQQRLDEKTRQMENVMLQAITTVANTVDAKDDYTGEHSVHVAQNATLLAKELGWTDEEIYNIYYAGLLHDIGKISVPDAILHKPTDLTEEELKIMKGHTTIGAEILKDIHIAKMARAVALHHHERYDGKGYPLGLAGEAIPLEARIVTIADSYDAMTSNRVYRDHLSKEQIIQELKKGRGGQFDPYLVDVFIKMVEEDKLKSFDSIQLNSEEVAISPVEESNQLLVRVMEANTKAVKREAMRDSLTGCYNRKYAEKQINSYLRQKKQGTCIMLDLDNFKQVNDRFGHVAGDYALRSVADMLGLIAKDRGVACRMGGDEFLLFLYEERDKEELRKLSVDMLKEYERIRQSNDSIDDTSISIGIAIAPEDGVTYQDIYDAADKALYFSKRGGKSSYCFYNEAMASELDARETIIDIHQLEEMMQSGNDSKGTFHVKYTEFEKIYRFVTRCVGRSNQDAQLMLLSLRNSVRPWESTKELEVEIRNLERAISNSLRRNDVSTRYSKSQILVVLIGIAEENMDLVKQRIIKKYKTIQTYPHYEVVCEEMTIRGDY